MIEPYKIVTDEQNSTLFQLQLPEITCKIRQSHIRKVSFSDRVRTHSVWVRSV